MNTSRFRFILFNLKIFGEIVLPIFFLCFCSATGEIFMELQEIEYGVWGMWQNVLALSIITCLFLSLSYVQLRRINNFK